MRQRMRRAVVLLVLAGACSGSKSDQTAGPQGVTSAEALPAVHVGTAELVCNIDSRANGTQKLVLNSGGGLEFFALVAPMVDGSVDLKGPGKGGSYRFTSHLTKPAKGTLTGVGDVEIETMETKVRVEMEAYDQPGGPGTRLAFTTEDMARKGIYVEFAGVARATNGEKHAFRVTLGAAEEGSGNVDPDGPNDKADMVAKAVRIRAPTTTVVQSITTVEKAR